MMVFHTYHDFLGVFKSTYYGIYTKIQEPWKLETTAKLSVKHQRKTTLVVMLI